MADQSDRPEPDHTEDPREGEISDRGYPESQPEGPGGGTSDYPDEGPQQDVATDPADDAETDAPSVSSAHERPPSKATGNPRAAGP